MRINVGNCESLNSKSFATKTNLKLGYIIRYRACQFQNKFNNTANIFYERFKRNIRYFFND